MNEVAALIAATLAAGTPLLLAALGIVVSEKSGVVNLGIEGIMLVAAVAGFGAAHVTGLPEPDSSPAPRPAALAGLFALLALGPVDQPVRDRSGARAVRCRAVGFRRPAAAGREPRGTRSRWNSAAA